LRANPSTTRTEAQRPERPSPSRATASGKTAVTIRYCIDGIRITGPQDKVVDAAWTFVQRCRDVGAQLKEIEISTATRNRVAALWKTKADFLGEVVDFTKKTIQCRQKQIDRLRELVSAAGNPQTRTYSVIFGIYALLLYTSETLAIRADRHFATQAYISTLARHLAQYPELWHRRCAASIPVDMRSWALEVFPNTPAYVCERPPITSVTNVDASRHGYAFITTSQRPDGTLYTSMCQRRWEATVAFDTGKSTNAEPEALCRSVDYAKRVSLPGSAAVMTDHEGFVGAWIRGYSMSTMYNARIGRLKDRHPTARLTHVEGATFIVDKYSRFDNRHVNKLEVADRIEAERTALRLFASCNAGRSVGSRESPPPAGAPVVWLDSPTFSLPSDHDEPLGEL
jgi:hypothetical protein